MFVSDFRAVEKADIAIDGITLVAGENGCGKSTISKLLFYSINAISNFETLVRKNLYQELKDVAQLLEIIVRDIPSDDEDSIKYRRRYLSQVYNLNEMVLKKSIPLRGVQNSWISFLEEIERIYFEYNSDYKEDVEEYNIEKLASRRNYSIRQVRMKRILKEVLQDTLMEEETSSDSQVNNDIPSNKFFQKIIKLIINKFKLAREAVDNRPTSFIKRELNRIFTEEGLPSDLDILEYDELIYSMKNDSTSLLFSIQDAIYIDNPMMFAVESSDNPHWNDLRSLFIGDGKHSNEISDIISNEVINGDIESSEELFAENNFKFKRSDDAVFNLLDMATGIKAFSILQLLIKNGHLNEKTLLIIDEPESNLHPQWIVEYARIVVLLHKKFKVKLFLASHNPDMVSAIRYISEEEGILDSVNFYLAEKSANKFKYSYKSLRHDIEPIFESFNIALSRINEYGVSE